jgi:site-specific recombinase XerD
MLQEMRIRNYSERTITTYLSLLTGFLTHMDRDPSEITIEDLKDYIYYRLQKDNISVSTINQTISSWRIFYVHILNKKWEGCLIVRPKREKRLPEVLSQEEALVLINSPKNIKHKAILYIMYSTGMRRDELLSLKVSDIDSSRMIVNIRQGKGKKDRQVILHLKVLELLREYYKRYRPCYYLFEGFSKEKRYSATSLTKIVKKNAKEAGIKKDISVHTLRHCFATHMLEKGVNLKVIQQLMGHTSIKTTSIYLSLAHIDNSKLPNPLDENE